MSMVEMHIKSSHDGSLEPALLEMPVKAGNVPLLVGLHTWSHDRFNQAEAMLPFCRERGWALLLPEFRGANKAGNPRAREACASVLARQDILDAVDFIQNKYSVDPAKIMILGGSGGGHMALMMAACAPARWLAVSSWVPITDLVTWYGETSKSVNSGYAKDLIACCGGAPGDSPAADQEYRDRSPLTYVKEICNARIAVHHGRYDKNVPYTHSWRLAVELEKLQAQRFFFEVFDGGHELRYPVAFNWFDSLLGEERRSSSRLTK